MSWYFCSPARELRGQQCAAVDVLEVAVGELVVALGVVAGFVVDAEVPGPLDHGIDDTVGAAHSGYKPDA
jgi:hypothetical protein